MIHVGDMEIKQQHHWEKHKIRLVFHPNIAQFGFLVYLDKRDRGWVDIVLFCVQCTVCFILNVTEKKLLG